MTALLLPGETLTLGLNVIVRAGDAHVATISGELYFVAPQDWVALTGPCPTCGGRGGEWEKDGPHDRWESCPDCIESLTLLDGHAVRTRRIVPLYTGCPRCADEPKCEHVLESGSHGWGCDKCGLSGVGPLLYHRDGMKCENRLVLVGRGSIEVVPVVGAYNGDDLLDARCVVVWGDRAELFDPALDADRWTRLSLDPLPVPGRDFGIVIDCVELVP